ncbi:Flagellar motor switch protein FliG [Buchnera aphidicola (Thelaxes suberi)]|uniref:FliG C-terminal domain-containing protein n=1 Tax=Buchnera aphidicola TaxID=9 RepID=UPI003464AEC8
MNLNGFEKSVYLLLSMNIEQSIEVVQNLTTEEKKEIVQYSLNMKDINYSKLKDIFSHEKELLNEINLFINKKKNQELHVSNIHSNDTNKIINTVTEIDYKKKFEENIKIFHTIKLEDLFNLIKKEPLQVIFIILIHLDRNVASELVNLFSLEKKSDLIIQIFEYTETITQDKYKKYNEIIQYLINRYYFIISDQNKIQNILKITELLDNNDKKKILIKIKEKKIDIAKKLAPFLLSFDNLFSLEEKFIIQIIKNITIKTLYISLYDQSRELKEKIIKYMSKKQLLEFNHEKNKKIFYTHALINQSKNKILKQIQNIFISNDIKIY